MLEQLVKDFLIMVSDLCSLTQCYHPHTPAQNMALRTLSTESIFQQLRYIFQFDHVAF